MPRGKVKLAFIENLNERKASYKKRKRGFLKKAYELSTLCDVEMAIAIYSPYRNGNEVFPNNDAAINTFTKFSEWPDMEKSKNMVAQKNFTEQRIKKIDEKLWKLRKENRVIELTNKMHDMLSGEDVPIGMHPCDLNDLSYVINQKIKQVCDAIKKKGGEEGSSSNAPQLDVRPVVPTWNIYDEEPREHQLDPKVVQELMASLEATLTIPSGTNSEGPMAPLLASEGFPTSMVHLAPPLVVPSAPQVHVFESSMFHPMNPLGTPPQRVHHQVPPSPSFLSQMFPPIIQQTFSQVPPTMLASSIPSSMMNPSMSPSLFSQMNPSINIHPFGASGSLNNYQNYSVGFPHSSALSGITSPVVPQTFSQVPPTILAPPIPSPMMDPSMSPSLFSQMNPSINIHPFGASGSLNNYQNYSVGFSQSPALPELTSPMVPQTFSQAPPTMLASPIPSPMMDPMSPTLFAQIMNPSMNIHPLDASGSQNNYQNDSVDFPQSQALSGITSPVVPQTFSQAPPTMLASPLPSPMMDPMSPTLYAEIMNLSMNIHPSGASGSVNNYQNDSVDFPQSHALSEITSPVVPQTFSQAPPTMLASPIPSPVMDPPMSPSLFAQTNPSMNTHPLDASVSLNNYQNNSTSFPQSPALSEMFNWNDDVMSLFDDAALYNINAQDDDNNNNNNL